MDVLIPFVILVLVAGNALYVAAEFAAVSVRRSRIQELASDGDRLAQVILPVTIERARLDRYVAACQIGITLTSLVLGAYGQATMPERLAPYLSDVSGMGQTAAFSASSIVVLAGLTGFQVVFAELVPKSIALQYPTRVALLTAIPMRWSLAAFRPFIWILNGSGLAILRVLGVRGGAHGHIHSPDEIEMLIAQSGPEEALTPEARLRMRKAIYLGTRPAHEIMVPRRYVEGVSDEASLDDVVRLVAASPYTRLPVYHRTIDSIIGIVHAKDVVLNEAAGRPKHRIEDLARSPLVVPESLTIERLLGLMRSQSTPMAILVDEFGGVEGLVTLEDILAELFGEFADEFKEGQPAPRELPGGVIRLPGLLPLDQAGVHLGESWDGQADTVGGHIMDVLGHIPEQGEQLIIGSFEVMVERVDHHAVQSILLRRAVEEEQAGV